MDSGKQLKLDIIVLLKLKKISIDEARLALNVSERTIERYLEQYQAKGPAFVFHGNSGKKPHNKISEKICMRASKLMKEKYFDFNMTHALEKLSEEENISINRETFREICHKIGMVKKAKRRGRKIHKARDRMGQSGVMLQMDGSPERWFGDKQSCLIGAIDDASSEVYYAEFFESETTLGCMKVLKRIIEKNGIFNILYVDRAGIYGGPKRVHFSQVKRALKELGINIILASSPQAKGRIERLWGTLQDRLIPEMRLRKIKSFDEANIYLADEFLPMEYNKKFKVLPRNLESAWRALPSGINLDEIFCIKEFRTVKNDHTYDWNGQTYKITSTLKYSIHNQKIEIRRYLDGSMGVFFADKKIDVLQHHRQPKIALDNEAGLIAADAIRVRMDAHIYYQSCYYSVNEKYIKSFVTVTEREKFILIYYRKTLIESHKKIVDSTLQKSSTKPDHLGPWQKMLLPGSIYRRAALRIGPDCDRVIFALLQRGQGVVDNKNIWAIVTLEKKYLRQNINEACKLAYELGTINYRNICTLLKLQDKKKGA